MSRRGHLDVVLASGFIDGWACDDTQPLRPLTVAVLRDGMEIARAVANIYRPDLAEAGCATGWCAFRARLSIPAGEAQGIPLMLVDAASGQTLHETLGLPQLDLPVSPMATVAQIIGQDPTQLENLSQLKGCAGVLDVFVRRYGVKDFVAAAFLYVLQRPVDHAGLEEYAHLIRQGLLTPLNMLYDLASSAEYRAKPKSLVAPCHPSFPFQEF